MTVLEVTNDPVRDYLNSIGRTHLLAAEEEVALAKRIEVGMLAGERIAARPELSPSERRELLWLADDGKRAFERFIEANLRLVVSIAKRYAGRGLPVMDLIQEGNLGLVRAVEKFDYRTGNKFSTPSGRPTRSRPVPRKHRDPRPRRSPTAITTLDRPGES